MTTAPLSSSTPSNHAGTCQVSPTPFLDQKLPTLGSSSTEVPLGDFAPKTLRVYLQSAPRLPHLWKR